VLRVYGPLLSNDCLCVSTALTFSKCATIFFHLRLGLPTNLLLLGFLIKHLYVFLIYSVRPRYMSQRSDGLSQIQTKYVSKQFLSPPTEQLDSSSNVSPLFSTDAYFRNSSWFSSVPQLELWDSIFKYFMTTSFPIFHFHRTLSLILFQAKYLMQLIQRHYCSSIFIFYIPLKSRYSPEDLQLSTL
jgi:hypothetical protein